jgi:shikimate kinase
VHVVLIGLMGSGKSTVGRPLAACLGFAFVDNDVMLERRTGRRARDIAAADGVDALHQLERAVLADALSDPVPAVITAAAAAPLVDGAEQFAGHHVVYLHGEPSTLAPRLVGGGGHRPFVDAGDTLELLRAQYAARDPMYRMLATTIVDAGRPPDAIVEAIIQAVAPTRT